MAGQLGKLGLVGRDVIALLDDQPERVREGVRLGGLGGREVGGGCQATLKTDPLATSKTDPRRNGVSTPRLLHTVT